MREMKDSHNKWCGAIPVSWNMIPYKHLFTIYSGATPKSEEPENWDGDIYWITPADYKTEDVYVSCGKRNLSQKGYDSCSTIIVPKNSLIISKRAPIGTVAISKNDLATNQGCLACVPNDNIATKYGYYVTSAAKEELELRGSGTTFLEISANTFANMPIPVPSINEQNDIVSFLDKKCLNISNSITRHKQIVKKLEEYKHSVITTTVTKGLSPNAEMKDSGIDWIGKVPETWRILRGKFILTILSRPVKPDDDVITCFRDGEVTLRKNRRTEGFTFSDKEIGYQGIEPGDLVVHGMDGFAGSIGISDSRGKATPVLNVMDSTQNKKYLMYYLRSMAYGDVFNAIATGIRVRSCNLNWNKLAELAYPVPPREEQDEIVRYIDRKLFYADELIAKKQMAIEKLEEYRESLIYHAVTGKIDCRSEEGADHV